MARIASTATAMIQAMEVLVLQHLDDAADAHDGRIEHDAQQHDHQHLDLLDIVGAAGDERGGGEAVHLRVGEGDHLAEHPAPQVPAEGSRHPRRQETGHRMVDAMLRSVTPSIFAPESRIYWVCMALVSMPREAYSFFTYTTALWVMRLSGAASRFS